MDPLDHLLLKLNFVWFLILQYFGNPKILAAFGVVVIIVSLALINRRN